LYNSKYVQPNNEQNTICVIIFKKKLKKNKEKFKLKKYEVCIIKMYLKVFRNARK